MIETTRDKSPEEVWAEPVTKVAERYGISDVGLKKICVNIINFASAQDIGKVGHAVGSVQAIEQDIDENIVIGLGQ